AFGLSPAVEGVLAVAGGLLAAVVFVLRVIRLPCRARTAWDPLADERKNPIKVESTPLTSVDAGRGVGHS
ncbi:hypothetical protein, partial [Streptomyces sp. NPDC004050]